MLAKGGADERDFAREAGLARVLSQARFLRSVAGDHQPGVHAARAGEAQRLDRLQQSLAGSEPADIDEAQRRVGLGCSAVVAQVRRAIDAVRHDLDGLPGRCAAERLQLRAREHDHQIRPSEHAPHQCGKGAPHYGGPSGGELVEHAAVHLVEHACAAQLGRGDVGEIAPVRPGIERGVDVHEAGAMARDRRAELQRAQREARQAPGQAFAAAFAADLEMQQVEPRGEARAEQAVQVRGHATDRLAARPEEQDDVARHAALRRGTGCTSRGRSASAPTPSDS